MVGEISTSFIVNVMIVPLVIMILIFIGAGILIKNNVKKGQAEENLTSEVKVVEKEN